MLTNQPASRSYINVVPTLSCPRALVSSKAMILELLQSCGRSSRWVGGGGGEDGGSSAETNGEAWRAGAFMKHNLERRQQRLTLPLDVGRCGDTICCQLVTTCAVAAACEQLCRGWWCITTVPPQFDYVPFFHPSIVSLGGCVFPEKNTRENSNVLFEPDCLYCHIIITKTAVRIN